MSVSNSTQALEASQAPARVQSSVGQALPSQLYEHTNNQGGHLHQGNHYGDKIYHMMGKTQELNVVETACDAIEACLPIEQVVESVWSLLISSEHYTLPRESRSDNSTGLEEIFHTPKSLERMLNDVKVTGRFMGAHDLNNPIPHCEMIINELREAIARIDELHTTSEHTHQSNRTPIKALIEIYGEGWIIDLASELEMVRSMVSGSISETLRSHMSQTRSKLQLIQKVAKRYGATGHDKLLELLESTRDYAGRILNKRNDQEIKSTCIQLINSVADSAGLRGGERASLQQLLQMLKHLEDQITLIESNLEILKSLHFKMIEARHQSITGPYESTFTWILNDGDSIQRPNSVEFSTWLKSRSGAFLLRGKAGSGKSTMMKFIFDHPKTKALLEEWAGGRTLIMAKHFFWRTGNKLQRSIVGLLRTLVFEILRSEPEFTRHVFETWNGMTTSPSDEEVDWTRTQLEGALKSILRHGGHEMTTKFCFFIDGLDEFEESDEMGENQGQLLLTLKEFCNSDYIKFCVSSRPINMLLNAALDNSGYRLQLEDFTRRDIETFVRAEFEKFRDLVQHDGLSQQLATDVVNRAEGVFLWVFLVVQSLTQGYVKGENSRMLRERLERFPQDIEAVFKYMVDAIDSERLPETAILFWLATSTDQSELALIYCAVDEILDHGTIPAFLEIPQSIMSEEDVTARINQLRKSLDIRSKGLLEVHSDEYATEPFSGHMVNYHHRTVREYLFHNGIAESMIKKHPLTCFGQDWPLIPCAATLTMIRRLPPEKTHELAFWLCGTMFSFARAAEQQLEDKDLLVRILQTAEAEWREKWPGYGDHWMRNASEAHVCSYISLQHPLCIRSLYHCDSKCRQPDHTAPLCYALRMNFAYAQDFSHERFAIQKQAVALLLRHNADPNRWDFYDNTTPWIAFIKIIKMASKLTHDEEILPTIKLLLHHGADPNALVDLPGIPPIPARKVLQDMFGATQVKEMLKQPERTHHLEGKHIIIAGLDMSSLSFIIALRKLWGSRPRPPRLTIIYGSETRHIYQRADQDEIQVFGHGAPADVSWLEDSGLPQEVYKSPGHRTGSFKIWNSNWTEIMSCNSSIVSQSEARSRIKMKDLRKVLIEAVDITDEIRWNVTCFAARKIPTGQIEVDVRCADLENYPLSTKLQCDLLIAADGALAFEPPTDEEMAIQTTVPASTSMVKSLETFHPPKYTGFVQIGGSAKFEQGLPSQVSEYWAKRLRGRPPSALERGSNRLKQKRLQN
ncbi:hypothetical protein CcaCcLH18_08142 [Colletotrichum camelliae]|nr:hypothetical protein CcaCcLH18_08142 [Colletotrichum camelliae]